MVSGVFESQISIDAQELYFECLAKDLETHGYSIRSASLPKALSDSLSLHLLQLGQENFEQAGIGREQSYMHNTLVRKTDISWITTDTAIGREWLAWTSAMQLYLNRRLLLGLFSFESHFARYAVGDFYQRHLDAFLGESNRVLSLVVYLNHQWGVDSGGELVLFENAQDCVGISVAPHFGTVVAFLSEEFPHEVRVSNRERLSISGWFWRQRCY